MPDGFSGAWIINEWAKTNNHTIEFFGAVYGKEGIPQINNRHLIFVDFSLKRAEMIQASKYAASITVLDHHKTAEANMKDLEPELYCPSTIIFDMQSAGCEIAAEYFFPGQSHPKVLHNIADRDLWNFDMEHTAAISSSVFSFEYTFENWDYIMNPKNYKKLIEEGEAITRKHTKDMKELFKQAIIWKNIEVNGKLYYIPTFNVPYFYSSELGHYAMKELNPPFALCWYINKDNKYSLSFRSTDEHEDVSIIAKEFGGGGHRNASGASVDFAIWVE